MWNWFKHTVSELAARAGTIAVLRFAGQIDDYWVFLSVLTLASLHAAATEMDFLISWHCLLSELNDDVAEYQR